jgi:hypothetical protein
MATLYGFGAYALGHGAKTMAEPAAIIIGVAAVALLAVATLYICPVMSNDWSVS